MSLSVIAPAIILPAWRDYQAAELMVRCRAADVREAEEANARRRRQAAALERDPAAVMRLARRELDYRVPGETQLAVPVALADQHEAREASPEPAPLPPAIGRLARHLPDTDYDAVFCEPVSRMRVLALGVSLLVITGILYWPRRSVLPQ